MKKFYRLSKREFFFKNINYLNKINFKPKNMFDIGCRDGNFTLMIKNSLKNNKNLTLYGLGLDKNKSKEASLKNIIVHNIDLNKKKLPFKDGEIDFISTNQVFEYIVNIDFLLEELFRVLSPKGYMIVSTPNFAALHERISLLLGFNPSVWHTSNIQLGLKKGKSTNIREHMNGFMVSSLKYLLSYYKFIPIKLKKSKVYISYNYYIPLLDCVLPTLSLSECWLCKK